MRAFMKNAAIALTLAGVSLATAGSASARDSNYGHAAIAINFGNIAFGYRDGYWDNGHTWHNWRNNSDYRNYRGRKGGSYHNWNHTRDANQGWQR